MKEKIKTLIYPFDEESASLLEFRDWMKPIDIIGVDIPSGWEKKFFLEKEFIKEILNVNIEEVELLWIVESMKKLTLEEFKNRIDFLTQRIKKVFVSKKLSVEEKDVLKQIASKNRVKIIDKKELGETEISQKFKKIEREYALKDIDIPVVMIAGMGECCNKFKLELMVASQLKKKGYEVSVISSRSYIDCIGVHSFPEFMYGTDLNENEKIVSYNNYIKELSELEKPNVFVIGIPGGILPPTRRQPGYFGVSAFEIFNAIKPDYMIFNLYNVDVEEQYLEEIEMLMKYKFGVEIDAFYISEYIQDALSLNTFMPIKYIRQTQSQIEEKWMNVKHNIYSECRVCLLVENIIDTLSDYKEIEIL